VHEFKKGDLVVSKYRHGIGMILVSFSFYSKAYVFWFKSQGRLWIHEKDLSHVARSPLTTIT